MGYYVLLTFGVRSGDTRDSQERLGGGSLGRNESLALGELMVSIELMVSARLLV